MFENKPFMLKMRKWGNINFLMSYFKTVGFRIKIKIMKKTLNVNLYKKTQRITVSS